ncbi:MAG: non-ribosomal peptide synthetase [Nocardioides sp.]|nr:non-ribosomal peptide synthetase [Nocardioides sp.]
MTTLPASRPARDALAAGHRMTAGHPLLGGSPHATALVSPDGELTYADLGHAVSAAAGALGPHRQLVLLPARNDVDTVVTYLAALAGRHPVLLVAPDDLDRQRDLVARYRPGIVAGASGPTSTGEPPPALHEDLALLLSTSGSTGSPKVARLSLAGVVANARSIATYLGIRPDDRAVTSLPMHYCYGLSVLSSHLVSGATVVLTELSVTDERFWELASRERVSSFAGAPHTFDLLDVSGFAERRLPHLRYLTQAGGRMPPETVTRYAELGRRRGWDLWVMYGQTEATARMAYLPPDLAASRPSAVGVPVPGGSLRLAPVPGLAQTVGEPEIGELVYAGPNVMMGYATGPDDLARGPELTELHTGDLARQGADGLWEITGRLDRHVKLFGLRLDLERLEQQLLAVGHDARIVALPDALHAFVTRTRVAPDVRRQLAASVGLPPGAIRVHVLDQLPMTTSGKCDDVALRRHAEAQHRVVAARVGAADAESLRDLLAVTLGRPDARTDDSFVSLGGDSLSMVEVSTRLGECLGELPPDWPSLTVDELARCRRRPRRRRRTIPVDVTIVLRALALLLILLTHTDIAQLPGGAHVLLAAAGFNLARFALAPTDRRTLRILAMLSSVALPAFVWIGACALVTGQYQLRSAVFLNSLLGEDRWSDDWQFWFLEALVWAYLAVAALLAVPLAGGWQRRDPFGFTVGVLVATLLLRWALVGIQAEGTEKYAVPVVLWVVALGWSAFEARTTRQRALLCVLTLIGVAGFFGNPLREGLVLLTVVVLVWARPVPLPRILARPTGLVASASLWIYLTHWQVYPELEAAGQAPLAVVASIVVGLAAARVYARSSAWLAHHLLGQHPRRRMPRASTHAGDACPAAGLSPGRAAASQPRPDR